MSEGWKTLQWEGSFEIDVPSAAKHSVSNGTGIIELPTSPVTEVLIGCFRLRDDEPESLETAIGNKVRFFIQDSISTAMGRFIEDWRGKSWRDGDVVVSEGLVLVDRSDDPQATRWWFVRAYGHNGSRDFYLIHWNGSWKDLKPIVLRIFESFCPFLGEQPESAGT